MLTEDSTHNPPISKIRQLRLAIANRKVEIVQKLLQEVDIQEKYNGESVLHMACTYKTSKEIFNILIRKFKEKGVSLDLLDKHERTALDNAFAVGNILAIEVLIKAGADYQRRWFNGLLEKTYLESFLEKHTNERERINHFIEQRGVIIEPIEEELKEVKDQEVSKKVEKPKTQKSSEESSLFNFVGGLINQFKGYIRVQNSDENITPNNTVGTKKQPKPFGKHIKED